MYGVFHPQAIMIRKLTNKAPRTRFKCNTNEPSNLRSKCMSKAMRAKLKMRVRRNGTGKYAVHSVERLVRATGLLLFLGMVV